MKRWKQFLVTGILAVSMAVSALPVFADEPQPVSTESKVQEAAITDTPNDEEPSGIQGETGQDGQQEEAQQDTEQTNPSLSPNALISPAAASSEAPAPTVTE